MTKHKITSTEVAKKLSESGCSVYPYIRRPNNISGELNFSLSRSRDARSIYVYSNTNATTSISVDRKARQAVITVKEDKRTISRNTYFWWNNNEVPIAKLREGALPNATNFVWELDEEKTTGDIKPGSDTSDYYYRYGKLTFTIPATTTSFLIGIDEDHTFISQLPKVVKTVEQAHKLLKPKGLNGKSHRVGEYFFRPVSRRLVDKLLQSKTKNGEVVSSSTKLRKFLNETRGSSTKLLRVTSSDTKKLYVVGQVNLGRRHKSLNLVDWHEVVPNNEVEVAHNFYD